MISARTVGSGPAVVLLHGFPLNRTIWDAQVSHLAARYRVIAPDLPGMGDSPCFPEGEPVSMAQIAGEILALLDSLQVEKAAFAGHSMGGYVTLALHQLAPERVAGIAMVASQANADTPEGRANRFALAERVKQMGPRAVAEGMGTKYFAPAVPSSSAIYLATQAIIRRTASKGIRDALLAMAGREDMRPHLASIRVPSLVIHGAQDQLVPMERAEYVQSAIVGAELVRLPEAGHMPMLEEPDAVNAALDQWLERVYG